MHTENYFLNWWEKIKYQNKERDIPSWWIGRLTIIMWRVCVLSRFSHVWLCDTMDCSPTGCSVHGSPGDLLNPGVKPASLTSPTLVGMFFTTSTTWEALLQWQFSMNDSIYSMQSLSKSQQAYFCRNWKADQRIQNSQNNFEKDEQSLES